MNYKVFVSESVCEGHPDKICDQVSDAVLDALLEQDQYSRAGIECLATTNRLIIAGEVTTKAKVNYEKIGRGVIKSLDYTDPIYNFHDKSKVEVLIHEQSPDISLGVEPGGAGDQGLMFGYACRETEQFMPLPIMIAHHLTKRIDQVRKSKTIPYLRPDGKSQVVVNYHNGKPTAVDKVVIAVPHQEDIKRPQLEIDIYKKVVRPILEEYKYKISPKDVIINGTGRWTIGGPHSDMGETGRKTVVDSYGGMGRVGGGCFSGKDPTKVDRTGHYACRYIAKNIVAKGMANRCEIIVGYVIGRPDPLAKAIDTFGTEKVSLKEIEKYAWGLLDLSVKGIINGLDLRKPVPYRKTARYGHFGWNQYPWEKLVSY